MVWIVCFGAAQKSTDIDRTILHAIENSELTEKEQAAIEILAAVTEQDIEITPDGKAVLREGVAKTGSFPLKTRKCGMVIKRAAANSMDTKHS